MRELKSIAPSRHTSRPFGLIPVFYGHTMKFARRMWNEPRPRSGVVSIPRPPLSVRSNGAIKRLRWILTSPCPVLRKRMRMSGEPNISSKMGALPKLPWPVRWRLQRPFRSETRWMPRAFLHGRHCTKQPSNAPWGETHTIHWSGDVSSRVGSSRDVVE
jgi:hypothetical protein